MTQTMQIKTATGAHTFQVEIAADDASRMRGLKGVRSMPPDHGMLFAFDQEAPRTFNMSGVEIPLDIIFLSQAGLVTHIVANAEPGSDHPIVGAGAAVLEVNGGTAAKLGLKVGDKIGGATMATEQIDPRLLRAAKQSPTLRYMIEHKLPLTREQWISLNYMGHPPEPWTAEHEAEVPTPFSLHPQDED